VTGPDPLGIDLHAVRLESKTPCTLVSDATASRASPRATPTFARVTKGARNEVVALVARNGAPQRLARVAVIGAQHGSAAVGDGLARCNGTQINTRLVLD
jgi:hypothetical protein